MTLCFAVLLASSTAIAQSSSQPSTSSPAFAGKGDDEGFGTYKPPVATIKPRTYNLEECLALADRNHPNVWAARARLAAVHGELDEAKFAPYFQGWFANANVGVLPAIGGNYLFNSVPASRRNLTGFDNLNPFVQLDIGLNLPLYTFGKITAIREAAEAKVRVQEWDLERSRQMTRMDVRRAYYGLKLARDAQYVIDEAMGRLDKGIGGMKEKLEADDKSVSETDLFRLEYFREEISTRVGEAKKGETYAQAALRFLTGIQTAFDIPDEPLKRPNRPLAAMPQYLSAARLFRPDLGMARAGVGARKSMLDFVRANLFPDIGLGGFASYAYSPTAPYGALPGDPFNHFWAGAGIGIRWNLDLLPRAARVAQAEAQLEEVRALERYALGGAQVEVENAYGIALEAKLREEAWDRAEHKAKQWISTIQDSIDVGTNDERALLEPLRAYGNARVQHLQALMDYNVALSQLAQSSGWDSSAPTE